MESAEEVKARLEKLQGKSSVHVSIDTEKEKNKVIAPNKSQRIIQISKRLGEIAREYGGESNVPINNDHEYWSLLDEYRKLCYS